MLNLTSITLKLTGAQAWAQVTGPLTSGMVGLPVAIEWDETWEGLTKNLVCRCSPWGSDEGESRAILNVGAHAAVAHEVMQAGMYLYLGVEGFRSDGTLVIPTTWARCGRIEPGANTCADPTADPELPVWDQVLVSSQAAAESAAKAAQSEANAQLNASSTAQLTRQAEQAQWAAETAANRAEAAAESVLSSVRTIDGIPRAILPAEGYILAETTAAEAAAPAWGNLAELYAAWDALAAQYPHNVTMEVLGKDASGLYDIRCYTITSNSDQFKWTLSTSQKNLKILWLSGIHGHESTIFVDDLKFFTELLKQEDEATARLMDNCNFKVVPAVSPWGYENGSRTNSNGVNLNRNFDASWALAGEDTNDYSGPSAMSEAETQIVAQFLEDNDDCYLAINRHSSSGFGPTSVLGYLVSQIEADNRLAFNTVRFMSNQIKRSDLFGYLTGSVAAAYDHASWAWEVGGVKSDGGNVSNNYRMRMAEPVWLPAGTVISNTAGYIFNVAEYSAYTSAESFTLRTYRTTGTAPYTTTADGYVRVGFGEDDTNYTNSDESVRSAHLATMSFVGGGINEDVLKRCLHTVEASTTQGTMDKWFNAMGIHGYLYEASPTNLVGDGYYASDWGREVWQRINVSNIGNLLYGLMLQNEDIVN